MFFGALTLALCAALKGSCPQDGGGHTYHETSDVQSTVCIGRQHTSSDAQTTQEPKLIRGLVAFMIHHFDPHHQQHQPHHRCSGTEKGSLSTKIEGQASNTY